jgi:hypothetical protein
MSVFEAYSKGRVSDGPVLSDVRSLSISALDILLFARFHRQNQIVNAPDDFSIANSSPSQIGYSFMTLFRGQFSRKCSDPRYKAYSILSLMYKEPLEGTAARLPETSDMDKHRSSKNIYQYYCEKVLD